MFLLKRRREMRRLKAAEIAAGTRRRHRTGKAPRRRQVSAATAAAAAGARADGAGGPPVVVERHGQVDVGGDGRHRRLGHGRRRRTASLLVRLGSFQRRERTHRHTPRRPVHNNNKIHIETRFSGGPMAARGPSVARSS